jgi:hypothetical protein
MYLYNDTINANLHQNIGMPRSTKAINQLPPATLGSLQKLGADLAVSRLRRKESLRTWAKRLGVSLSTLQRLEAGDPSVSIGVVATALWLINRDGALGNLASPEHDLSALELDVRQAVQLGQARAQASAETRLRASASKNSTSTGKD